MFACGSFAETAEWSEAAKQFYKEDEESGFDTNSDDEGADERAYVTVGIPLRNSEMERRRTFCAVAKKRPQRNWGLVFLRITCAER